ncbi:hypothetical protein TDB9533_00130 [Thalassocella blandensis]|nr:hypothetical protein TDB9533_00130 [Thalassocella blandensis]
MSKLIRDDNPQNELAVEDSGPLSNAAVIQHLKACQQIAVDFSQRAFAKFIELVDEAFTQDIDRALSNAEASHLTEVRRLIRENKDELTRYYWKYLAEGFVKFKKGQLNTRVKTGGEEAEEVDLSTEELALVAHEDLDEAIAITSLFQRAEAYYAEPLWALNQRFAVLNGGERVTEASNPAAPIQLCESLRKTLKILSITIEDKIRIYKVYDTRLLEMSKNIVQETNRYLQQAGVLPNLRYSLPKGKAPESFLNGDTETTTENESQVSAEFASDPNLTPEEYQHELLVAIRQLQGQISKSQAANDAVINVKQVQLVDALQNMQHGAEQTQILQTQADDTVLAPMDFNGVLEQIKNMLSTGDKEAVVADDGLQTIDLVGMVFEYMLNDENLPDRVKALLSYLHTPFLKIAFMDPDFFEKSDHPARLLLNNLAEAGSRWVGNDGTQQFDMYNKIKEVVNKVLQEFDSDIKVITNLLLEFKNHTKSILRRQDLLEKRATEKAQGEERLREVKMRVNDEIRGRTHKKDLPSAVLLFLLQPWTDYLSFALLRYGDQSEKWLRAISVVDDLLWSITPKSTDADKKLQRELLDSIGARINAGFETIGFDPAKGKKLVEAINALIKLACESKKAEPASGTMRQELEKIAAKKAGAEEEVNRQLTTAETQMIEKLKMMEFGTWVELEGGKRLKVAWYNARTSHYMLVDQTGKRVDMISGRDMAKKMLAKSLKVISGSSKPFFERALENVFQKLNRQAETRKA